MTGISPRVFSLVFGVVYAVVVAGNFPLFIYYPQVGRFTLTDLADPSLGPEMFYYGWIASAGIVALVLAAIVPKNIAGRIPLSAFWLVPLLMFAGGFYRERAWFFY